ncbi:hypothetical protein GE09DRAFT_1244749 [Coniochaeta sp. 2T2.1]|nr:hypothetical protein GE09DRAFT_1244749 [Coniochaeta sp. 2T2.1]
MIEACQREGGVLLVQPKHLLSFKLMGINRNFESISRDIVNENDENFSVKFELIYTIGSQAAVEMSPNRWILIQELIDMTELVVRWLMESETSVAGVPEGLLFEDHGTGRVPVIRVLGESAGREVIKTLTAEVYRRRLRGLPVHHQTIQIREAILNYILLETPAKEDIEIGVLLFILGQKRFRVNYGLALDRQPPTMLAVPYRAKDIPSPRPEFSHPDVVIVLTCLSYYYHGLSHTELYTCLKLLNISDQADEEYTKYVADFYLTRVDLAKAKSQPLTGFSGTNNSKEVLPLSVKALNLQPHTNATVLTTLFQEENKVLELGDRGGSRLSTVTEGMISTLVESEQAMQVILDIGAQIISSSNFQMAEKLLRLASLSYFDAVIFFNDQNELSVLTRNGIVNSFLTSPFATHTDRCLVFLDQAHTRGTDLKLPDYYRAAVTLGPGVTKDTLIQADIRIRKLGQGQSVTFIVSPEMRKRIRVIRNITNRRALTVRDVLAWAISKSWHEAARSVPLWATQGKRHLRQEEIWNQANDPGGFRHAAVKEYLEPEAMSLDQRYRPTTNYDQNLLTNSIASLSLHPQLAAINQKLCAFSDSTRTTPSSTLQEEQERELAPEIEEERQVSKPPPRQALKHTVHPDVELFILTDHIPPKSPAFINPFAPFSTTGAAALFPGLLSSFPSDLLVTRDFARTVDEIGPGYVSDSYQRNVQWVLTSTDTDSGTTRMVVISPYEAAWAKSRLERCQSLDGDSAPVTLHAYLPRSSLSFRSIEDLKTYTIPPDYREYTRLCRYLGLAYTENRGDKVVGRDGFIGKRGYAECGFRESPVAFLREVFGRMRRDCVGIEKTHMGRVLAGEVLGEREFEAGGEGGGGSG